MRSKPIALFMVLIMAFMLSACAVTGIEIGGSLPEEVVDRIEDDDAPVLYDRQRPLVTLHFADGEALTIVELCHASDVIVDTEYERCDIKAISQY
ncbi:MAG: hypothetical protein OXH73_21835 [Caldilineaceae bacterium]|nr:hypothetical protein [Caldilineaceae bacterium]